MNLSQLAHRRRPVLYLATVVAMLYGIFSYFAMPAREDPEITIREALVTTAYPGLPAEQVEQNISKPLEESIRAIGEVERIRSTSMRGRSILHVEIKDRYFNLEQIWDELRKKVEAATPKLPRAPRTRSSTMTSAMSRSSPRR